MSDSMEEALKNVNLNPANKYNDPDEHPSESNRVEGRIIKVNSEKGWGFISSKQIEFTRIFFHWSEVKSFHWKDVKRGMKCTFIPKFVADKPKGEEWRALRIRIIEAEEEKK